MHKFSGHHPSPITHHLISLAPELQSPESVVVSRQIDFLTSKKPTTYGTYVLYLVYSPARQLLSSKLARAIDSSTSKPNNEPLHSFLSYVQSESQMCTFTCSNPPSFFFHVRLAPSRIQRLLLKISHDQFNPKARRTSKPAGERLKRCPKWNLNARLHT